MKEDIINSRNKLIIIDYADSILPRIGLTGHDFLVDKNNQYLIFTRNGLEYGASEESLSVFLQEGNIVTIDYLITYGENA